MKRELILALFLTINLGGLIVAADPPNLINYQGVLRDDAGRPLDGPHDMVFRFYDTDGPCPSGGTLLLADSHLVGQTGAVTVDGGLFDVHLGAGTISGASSLADVFRDHTEVWMEVQVNAEILCPRIRVTSAAYALNSALLAGSSLADIRDDIEASAPWTVVSGSLSAAVAQVGTSEKTLFISGPVPLGQTPNDCVNQYPDCLRVPRNITLRFERGGAIEIVAEGAPGTTQRLEIEASVEAGPYQIFKFVPDDPERTAEQLVTFRGPIDQVYPQWWGARDCDPSTVLRDIPCSPETEQRANTQAFNSALLTGRTVQVPHGRYELHGALIGKSDQRIQCSGAGGLAGPSGTILVQYADGEPVIKWTDESHFSLRDCRIKGSDSHALHVIADAAEVNLPAFENLEIEGWGAGAVGLFLDVQSNEEIYFAHIRNVTLDGGIAENQVGLRVGGDGSTQVVAGSVHGGRITNVLTGVEVHKSSGLMIYGLSLDGITAGGAGTGIHCRTGANEMMAYGVRYEFPAVDKLAVFESGSANNLLWGLLGGPSPTDLIDEGTNNQVFGSDGSGGFYNRYTYPIFLPNMRRLVCQIVSACQANLQPCLVDIDCCSNQCIANLCDGDDSFPVPRLECCLPSGKACTSPADCCSKNCVNHQCTN